MELRHLRYFVAVAEDLNFSRAAQRLHVSQPPLSRQVKDLEGELGVRLFERVKNKVRLTDAGQALYPEAKRLLEQSQALLRQARRLSQSQRQKLSIGYIANVQGHLVIESAAKFRKAHPDVAVKVFDYTTSEQIAGILSGKLDLGFVGLLEAPAHEGLHFEKIGSTYAVMALPKGHPLARRKVQALSAFRNERFITISSATFSSARQYVLQFCAGAGFEPRIVHEALQPIDILNLVAIGQGVALVPEQMRRLPHEGVIFRELSGPVPHADSYVAWRKEDASDVLMEFVRASKAAYPELMRSPG